MVIYFNHIPFSNVDRAYHGHTAALIDISPYKFRKLGAKGKKDHIHVAPTPDPYRGMFQGAATPEMGEKYALEVKKLIDQAQKDGKKVSASTGSVDLKTCKQPQHLKFEILKWRHFAKLNFHEFGDH